MLIILQTGCLSLAFVALIKMASFLRKLWLKTAIKIRKNYNTKHGLPQDEGIGGIDINSLSYQMDSVEGAIVSIALFLLGLLWTLIVPIQAHNLFSIFSAVISFALFFYCWSVRNSGTKRFRVLVYIACSATVILAVHIIASFILDTTLLVHYNNSFNAVLYIWTVMLLYKLLLDRKQ